MEANEAELRSEEENPVSPDGEALVVLKTEPGIPNDEIILKEDVAKMLAEISLKNDKEVNTIVRKEPYSLPDAFEWADVDIDNPGHLNDLYVLLTENYVEDNLSKFRFNYSPDFLIWTLRVPDMIPNLLCGVRAKMTGRLIAFISSIPQNIRVYEKVIRLGEINFLCVHKRLRGKKVAPVLIREITRRANILGFNQAVYTAGIVLPRPIAFCQYHHRSLNPRVPSST